jgi:hypothetical protein
MDFDFENKKRKNIKKETYLITKLASAVKLEVFAHLRPEFVHVGGARREHALAGSELASHCLLEQLADLVCSPSLFCNCAAIIYFEFIKGLRVDN